jgi:Zn ribbon nucleic-acid-binding protein
MNAAPSCHDCKATDTAMWYICTDGRTRCAGCHYTDRQTKKED